MLWEGEAEFKAEWPDLEQELASGSTLPSAPRELPPPPLHSYVLGHLTLGQLFIDPPSSELIYQKGGTSLLDTFHPKILSEELGVGYIFY